LLRLSFATHFSEEGWILIQKLITAACNTACWTTWREPRGVGRKKSHFTFGHFALFGFSGNIRKIPWGFDASRSLTRKRLPLFLWGRTRFKGFLNQHWKPRTLLGATYLLLLGRSFWAKTVLRRFSSPELGPSEQAVL
jgi:hypothetical protein